MANQYTIGEVSKEVGLSTKTIRYYESIRLIKSASRRTNNYRLYSEQDLQKLRLIVEAKNLGIPLNEVKNIVTAAYDAGCVHLKDYLTKRIPEYIAHTDEKILKLQKMKDRLNLIQKNLQENCTDCSDVNECYKFLHAD